MRAGDGTAGTTAAHRPGRPGARSSASGHATGGKAAARGGRPAARKQGGPKSGHGAPPSAGGQAAGGAAEPTTGTPSATQSGGAQGGRRNGAPNTRQQANPNAKKGGAAQNPSRQRGRGGQRSGRAGGRPTRGARPNARLKTVLETSAGGLVIRGLAESVRSGPDDARSAVDFSALEVALIGRLDRRGRMLWSMPKGHIEAGETVAQTARREVLEETGLDGTVLSPLGDIDYWFVAEGRRIHKTVHHHLIRYDRGELCDEDPEITEVAWVPFLDLPGRLAYPDERRLVDTARALLPDLAVAEREGRGPVAAPAQRVDPARRHHHDDNRGDDGSDGGSDDATGARGRRPGAHPEEPRP